MALNDYTDTVMHYNLAESIYKNINVLSSWQVVIGDPKTTIRLDNFAGINSNSKGNNFGIYPNPIHSNFLNISSDNGIARIKVYGLDGRLLIENSGPSILGIDITNLPRGTYIVEALIENELHTTKLIRQ